MKELRTEVSSWIQDLAAKLRPEYRFDESHASNPEHWRDAFRGKLFQLLGPMPPQVDPAAEWQLLEDRERYSLHRVRYLTEPGLAAFAYVAIPQGASGPVPGVLCLHGHGPLGADPLFGVGDDPRLQEQIDKYHYDYGHRLAERGLVVWAPNLRGFGARLSEIERNQSRRDPCNMTFFQQMWLGRVAITGQLHELRVATDLLAGMDDVDASAIGCAGLSYGGRLTTYHAALDTRIKAGIISGAMQSIVELIGSYKSCGQQVVPGQLLYGDLADVMGLTAPRCLAIELGREDPLCPPAVADREYTRLQSIFAAFAVEPNLVRFDFDGGHIFQGRESISWLCSQLKSASRA